MSEQEIIFKNQIIALFDGWELKPNGVDYRRQIDETTSQTCNGGYFRYHESWDAFMPVWYKFNKTYLPNPNIETRKQLDSFKLSVGDCILYLCNSNLIKASSELALAINWYNEQLLKGTAKINCRLVLIKSTQLPDSHVYVNAIGYTPYLISEEKKIEVGERYLNGKINAICDNYKGIYQYSDHALHYKIIKYPTDFSDELLQDIIKEKYKNWDIITL